MEIVAIAFLAVLFYRSGVLLKKILNSKQEDFATTMLYGFFTTLTIFEIIQIPFNIFNLSVKISFFIQLIVWSLLIVLSIFVKRNVNVYEIKLKKSLSKKELIPVIIFALLVVFQIANSVYLQRSDADDAFYVSWAQEAKSFEQYMNTEPSTGQENSVFPKTYILNSWEIFNGFIAKLFNADITILLHTFYPILIITLAYFAYTLLIKKMTENKNSYWMAIIFATIILFDGASARFRGSTLLGRSYQGKAILLNIVITFIYYKLIEYKQLKKEDIIILAIANITAIALNPIAIWLIPLIYFLFAIYMLLHKDIKSVLKLAAALIPNFVSLPIFLICSVFTGSGGVEVTYILSYKEILKDFVRDGKLYILLYAIACLITIIKGNKKAKMLVVFIPLIAFVTILNPFISKYMQKYVTSSATYWRLLWIIPMEIGISYAAYVLFESEKLAKIKYIIFAISIAVVVICGRYMYMEKCNFFKHENLEKIDKCIVEETNFIKAHIKQGKVTVVAPEEPKHGSNMRQLTNNIILFYSRPAYVSSMENYRAKDEIYYKMYRYKEVQAVYDFMEKWKVDFIILEKGDELIEKIDKTRVPIAYEDEKNVVFYNKESAKINI